MSRDFRSAWREFLKNMASPLHLSHIELYAFCLSILRINLRHPKAQAINEISCADCRKSYIGETGRPFGVRLAEHQKEVQKLESLHYTRSTRKASVTEQQKSAITDHVAATNHSINWWEEAEVIDREADKCTRWLKEAIWIRIYRRGQQTLNKDEGAYLHSFTYHFWSTHPHHALSGNFPDMPEVQRSCAEWIGLPVWWSC